MASSARRRTGRLSIAGAALLFVMITLLVAAAKPAAAAANSGVTGRGSTAQFTCLTGFQTSATISFTATKSKGVVSGGGAISGGALVQFAIGSGTMNTSSYSLQGTTNNIVCGTFFTLLPAHLTLTGQCGTGVIIHYSDTAGDVGDFVGNASCT